jgi:hypothetical protein
MKEINVLELENEKDRINRELDFISEQIKKLEKTLQESAFLSYEYMVKSYGYIKWGEILQGDTLIRRLIVMYKEKYRPLIECPAEMRWAMFHHLQDFVDNLVKHQKSRTQHENNQTPTEKS